MKAVFLLILLVIPVALADSPPVIPHQFYGEINYLGEPVDGYQIIAEIGGSQFSSDIIGGRFGTSPFLIESLEAGDIVFSINGYEVGTHEFILGEYTELNFDITSDIFSSDKSSGRSMSTAGSRNTQSSNLVAEQSEESSTERAGSDEQEEQQAEEKMSHSPVITAITGAAAQFNELPAKSKIVAVGALPVIGVLSIILKKKLIS